MKRQEHLLFPIAPTKSSTKVDIMALLLRKYTNVYIILI